MESTTQYRVVQNFDDLLKSFFVRGIVFCEGQGIAYSDEVDGFDFSAVHFLGVIDDEPVATARMRFLGDFVKIERLAVREKYRGKGIGKEMFTFILNHISKMECTKLKLHSQAYLVKFYEDFGFVKKGESFFEADIEHYYMEKVE